MEKFLKNQQIPLTQVIDPNTGQAYYSPQNVVYQDKNNTGVTYLKNVRVDQAITASYFSGSITNAISASYALTASYAMNGGGGGGSTDTGSLLTTASFSNPNLTFTKGNGSTFNVSLLSLVPTSASYAVSASYVSGSITAPGLDTQIIYNNGGVLGANSGFVYSGSNVGVGTSSPPSKLSVIGKLFLADGVNSIFIGPDAGKLDDGTSNNNIAIGSSSLANNISSIQNVAIGNNSQRSSSASNNTSVGTSTLLFNTTGAPNTAIGAFSQVSSSTGTFNTTLGTNTLFNNTVDSFHTALGSSGLFSLLTGSSNTGIGTSVLFSLITGSENNALGRNAGRYFGAGTSALTSASASIFIGFNSRANAVGETNQIVIGNEALGLGSNTVVLGNDSIVTTSLKGNIGIGKTNPSTRLDISGSTTITGSLIVTGGITGSLLGTASYAIQVLSSSYAATASYINPLIQNIIVTGSYNMQSNTGGHNLFFNNSGQLGSTTTGYHILMSPSANTTFFNQVGYHQNGLNVTPGGNSTTYGLSVTIGSYPTATIATFSSGSVTALTISGSGMRGTGSFDYLGSISATSFTGSLLGTASISLTASYIDGGTF
jgi:hypothetical protein